VNENVIGMLKRFKIIAVKYRNRRKRFGLRFNLISGFRNKIFFFQNWITWANVFHVPVTTTMDKHW